MLSRTFAARRDTLTPLLRASRHAPLITGTCLSFFGQSRSFDVPVASSAFCIAGLRSCFSTEHSQAPPSYPGNAAPLSAREQELEDLKQRLRGLGPSPNLSKQLGRDPEVPATYVDPNSLSGNPALATVSVRAADAADAVPARPTLVRDAEEAAVFHHAPSEPIPLGAPDAAAAEAAAAAAVGGGPLGQIDPRMVIAMTCKVCDTRLVKSMSKKSYQTGVVLIRCDGCRSTHLIADNLGWFDDHSVNIEDIMREQGAEVTRASADVGPHGAGEELSEEVLERVRRAANTARESDLAAPVGGARVMQQQKQQQQEGQAQWPAEQV